MSDAYVRVMFKRLGARAGIEKRVHAHGLRHTHAAQLRAEGVDIAIFSRQLNHASITTTARYLDHLAPRVVERYRSAQRTTHFFDLLKFITLGHSSISVQLSRRLSFCCKRPTFHD